MDQIAHINVDEAAAELVQLDSKLVDVIRAAYAPYTSRNPNHELSVAEIKKRFVQINDDDHSPGQVLDAYIASFGGEYTSESRFNIPDLLFVLREAKTKLDAAKAAKKAEKMEFKELSASENFARVAASLQDLAADVPEAGLSGADLGMIAELIPNLPQDLEQALQSLSRYLLQGAQLLQVLHTLPESGYPLDLSFREILEQLSKLEEYASLPEGISGLSAKISTFYESSQQDALAVTLSLPESSSIMNHDLAKKWIRSAYLMMFMAPFNGKYLIPEESMIMGDEDNNPVVDISIREYMREILSTFAYISLQLKSLLQLPAEDTEFERSFTSKQAALVQENISTFASTDGYAAVRTIALNAVNEILRLQSTGAEGLLREQKVQVDELSEAERMTFVENAPDDGARVIYLHNGDLNSFQDYQTIRVTNYTTAEGADKLFEKALRYHNEVASVKESDEPADLAAREGLRLAALALAEIRDAQLALNLVPVQEGVRVEVYLTYPTTSVYSPTEG